MCLCVRVKVYVYVNIIYVMHLWKISHDIEINPTDLCYYHFECRRVYFVKVSQIETWNIRKDDLEITIYHGYMVF